MNQLRNVAILIFNDVEVLDFAGPFEVFSITGRRDGLNPFNVYTVAEAAAPVLARNHLSVNPRYTFDNCPPPDILLVPGGGGYSEGKPYGTRLEMHNQVLLNWIRHCAKSTELLLSVCTGSLVLAQANLLDGLAVTTHHGAIEELKQLIPHAQIQHNERIVDNGHIILSAGISAGIDMSLHVVAKLLGRAQAVETATYMEYDWQERALVL